MSATAGAAPAAEQEDAPEVSTGLLSAGAASEEVPPARRRLSRGAPWQLAAVSVGLLLGGAAVLAACHYGLVAGSSASTPSTASVRGAVGLRFQLVDAKCSAHPKCASLSHDPAANEDCCPSSVDGEMMECCENKVKVVGTKPYPSSSLPIVDTREDAGMLGSSLGSGSAYPGWVSPHQMEIYGEELCGSIYCAPGSPCCGVTADGAAICGAPGGFCCEHIACAAESECCGGLCLAKGTLCTLT